MGSGQDGGDFNNLGKGNGEGGNGGFRDNAPDAELDDEQFTNIANDRHDHRGDREFQLVNYRNINFVQFSGRNLHTNP